METALKLFFDIYLSVPKDTEIVTDRSDLYRDATLMYRDSCASFLGFRFAEIFKLHDSTGKDKFIAIRTTQLVLDEDEDEDEDVESESKEPDYIECDSYKALFDFTCMSTLFVANDSLALVFTLSECNPALDKDMSQVSKLQKKYNLSRSKIFVTHYVLVDILKCTDSDIKVIDAITEYCKRKSV